jgi:hypothetical protein
MTNIYSNIPNTKTANSSDQTVEVFSNYGQASINISNNDLIALAGYFESKGFDIGAAENTAIIILTQAAKDGYDAMQIMDSLKSLGDVEISGLVAEILNYNRLKTSLLGVTQSIIPSEEVLRNVIA